MTLADVSLGELEVDAEGLALAIDKMAELAVGAESRPFITERFLTALTHVWVGPAEANNRVIQSSHYLSLIRSLIHSLI